MGADSALPWRWTVELQPHRTLQVAENAITHYQSRLVLSR